MLNDKGTLKTWKSDRGFGFIKPDAGDKDIFVHISDFGNIERPPRVGDRVEFQLLRSSTGKISAGNVYIDGVQRISTAPENNKAGPQRPPRREYNRHKDSGFRSVLLTGLLLATAGSYLWTKVQSNTSPPTVTSRTSTTPSATRTTRFKCTGKQHCSQMRSCAEAKFYIRNCPNTKMDGDNDGVPCERQLCRR